jgi:cell division septation protein DedD
MISQESIYMDTALSDFSTALLRANKNEKHSKSTLDRSVNTSSYENTATGNRNLSSVLSQIQDDGPAGEDISKPDYRLNQAANKVDSNDINTYNQQHPGFTKTEINQKALQDYTTNELLRKTILTSDGTDENAKNSIWPQMLLMLFVAIVSVASLFVIYTKTNDMEAILNLYDARIKDSETSRSIEISSPGITSINEALQSVQQELQLIKAEYPAMLVNRTSSQQIDEAVEAKHNVSVLEEEILALKSELKTVNSKLKAIDIDNSPGKNVVTTKSDGWVVNLASFTNKNSAEKVVDILYAAGLSPSLQQAVVNDEQVFRLIVDGFENRNDAESFIREAGKKYGMNNGWVRKAQQVN